VISRLAPSALVPLLALAAAPAAGQQLSPQEQAIVRSVDAHAADAVNFLERIVNINSGTLNPAGVREVGRHFQAPLDSLGFDVRWIDMPDSLTGDEESAGRPLEISRHHLIEAGRNSDAALEFETGSRDALGEYAVVARRSSSGWTLRVRGRTGHSSGVFGEGSGSGAIFEAARILNAFHEELRGEPNLTFNPGVIVGGTDVEYDPRRSAGTAFGKTNVIAQTAIVTGDIRTLTDEQLQRTRERMRAIVARHLPRTEAEITFGEGYPSMPPTEGNQTLLDVLNTVNRDLGTAPMQAFDPGRRGAADVSFVAP
jgi:glutamate carboxypeptidase